MLKNCLMLWALYVFFIAVNIFMKASPSFKQSSELLWKSGPSKLSLLLTWPTILLMRRVSSIYSIIHWYSRSLIVSIVITRKSIVPINNWCDWSYCCFTQWASNDSMRGINGNEQQGDRVRGIESRGSKIAQSNFEHSVDSTASIHFIPSKFDPWYKMYGGGRI